MSFISPVLAYVAAGFSIATAAVNPANYIGGVGFNPDRDIDDLDGKVVLITGGKTQSSMNSTLTSQP